MKKILIASDTATHPCTNGNRQCILQYAEDLRKLGFEVFFLLLGSQETSEESIRETRKNWEGHFFYYPLPPLQLLWMRIYKRAIRKSYPDNIDFYSPAGIVDYVNTLHARHNFTGMIVNYIWQSKLAFCKIPIKAIFTHDVFAFREERFTTGKNWHSHTVKEEAKAIRRFKQVLAIQDVERDYFKYLSPKSHIHSVYSSFNYINQDVEKNNYILFFSGDNSFNISGIEYFIKEAFPYIIKKEPNIKLIIGGGICKKLSKYNFHKNIDIKGQYANPSDFYKLGNIVINPVYEGSGLKIKTFEAIAHGKITITDPHSATGIYQPEHAPILIARTPADYANIITQYINSPCKIIDYKKKCYSYIDSLNNYILSQYKDIFGDGNETK